MKNKLVLVFCAVALIYSLFHFSGLLGVHDLNSFSDFSILIVTAIGALFLLRKGSSFNNWKAEQDSEKAHEMNKKSMENLMSPDVLILLFIVVLPYIIFVGSFVYPLVILILYSLIKLQLNSQVGIDEK